MELNSKNEISYVNPNRGSLKKFTIPRKKSADKAYLEICHTDWREYSFIQSTLEGSKLDGSYSLNTLWKFGDMKLIHNVKLEQRFAEKRAKMREDGRRGKELEESTFFLATSHIAAFKLYHEGLKCNVSSLQALGNPACGVYLHRHIDVLLRHHQLNNLATETILFFKVLLGKVKTIPPCMKKTKTGVDPTAKFDCHMSQIPASLKEPISTQIINSAVYLYEFNALCETMERPRQCLPYALVTVRFVGQRVKNAVTPLRFSTATTNCPLPDVSTLTSCTVAQRLGRGKNAKVVFQHFGKKENTSVLPVQFSPPQFSPANSLGKVAASKMNQDPRLLKRYSCVENGKEYSVPSQISPPSEPLCNINSLMKTLRFLNACPSSPAQQLRAPQAGQQALYRSRQEQAQSQDLENPTVECEKSEPFGASMPVTTVASGGLQNTADSPSLVPEAAPCQQPKEAQQGNDLTSLTELNMKICSGTQVNKAPSQSSTSEPVDQPFCEDLNLYESEVKKKLKKYSEYLVLCDKERICKIQSLKKLSRIDKKAFYCRLKKYDKYYERYQNELGLDKCCNAIVCKPWDVTYPYSSNYSAGKGAKSCSCVLTELVLRDIACSLSGSKQQEQSEAPSLNAKGTDDKSVGGLQTSAVAASNRLCDRSWVGNGISHRTEGLTAERLAVGGEDVPATSNVIGGLKGELQSSLSHEKANLTEDESVVTKSPVQVVSPSIASSQHAAQAMEFNFLSAAAHSPDQMVRHEPPALLEIPEGNRNVCLHEEEVMAEEMRSSWENGELSETEDRWFSDSPLDEVPTSAPSSRYLDEVYEEPLNLDSLLHFLAARIEWGKLFLKSKAKELKISPESATSPENCSQQILPPTASKPGQLAPHCSGSAGSNGEMVQQSSRSFSETLSIPDHQPTIPNLQITLSYEFNAEYDQHQTLADPSTGSDDSLWRAGESHVGTSSITETKPEQCCKTIGKDHEAVLDGDTGKPAPTAENLGLKYKFGKEINYVFTNIEDDVSGLGSNDGLRHALNKEVSSSPGPRPTRNYKQGGELPWNKQPPGGEQSGISQSPKCVEQWASGQSNEKDTASGNAARLAVAGFLKESPDTSGIHTGNTMSRTKPGGDYPKTLTDNLCEDTVLRKKMRKKSTLKPHAKDRNELKPHSKKTIDLKEDSTVTSNSDVSLNLKHVDSDLYKTNVTATENSKHKGGLSSHEGVAFLRSRHHKIIKKGSSVQFTGKPKGTLCPDENVKNLLRKLRLTNNKALALAHTNTSTEYVPHVCSTDGSKKKVQGSYRSAGNLASLYEGCIDTFSSSKRQIAQVASVLSSEASLSKSCRLSKLLTKAVRNLNKAYDKVGKSSEIVKRIGGTMISLPKSYQSNCNTFWESCDVNGRQYHKKHWHRSVTETDPQSSRCKKQRLAKKLILPHKCCEPPCKGVLGADFKRLARKQAPMTLVEKPNGMARVELASTTSTVGNPIPQSSAVTQGDCAQSTGSNLNRVRQHNPCKANLSVSVFERTEPSIVASQAESTSVKSQVGCHLLSAEILDLPDESKPSESLSGPKQSESLSGPKPSESLSGPKPSESLSGPKPSESPSGPKQSESLSGPKQSESLSGPKQSESPSGPKQSEYLSGPKQSESLSGPKPSESPSGPKQSESPSGPKQSEYLSGPKQSESLSGPKPSESPSGPKQSEYLSGHKQSESPFGSKPSESLSGPKQSESLSGPKQSKYLSRHKQSESPARAKLEEPQVECHIDSPEDRLCSGAETQVETILECPVDSPVVEPCFDSQMAEFLNVSPKVKIPLASQTADSLGEGQPLKSSNHRQRAEAQCGNHGLQSHCGFKTANVPGQDQPAHSKAGGSDILIFPGGFPKLDFLAHLRIPNSTAKSGAAQQLIDPQPMEVQLDSLERRARVDTTQEGLYQCEHDSAEPRVAELTELHQRVATRPEHQKPWSCAEYKVAECQAATPKRESHTEFLLIKSQAVASRAETQMASSESSGADFECPARLQCAGSTVQGPLVQCGADCQVVDAHTDSPTVAFQGGPCLPQYRRGDFTLECNNEQSPKMQEGEIVSDVDSALVGSGGAGRVEEQSLCMEGPGSTHGLSQSAQGAGSLMAEISEILQRADGTSSLEVLEQLRARCRAMLPAFVLGFERRQGESVAETLLCRDWLLRNGMQSAVRAVQLKPAALDPYVELQMMLEAWQFVANKVSFLKGLPTVRSLLWYDPTLYGELLAEKAGYQQQWPLYPSFQERVQHDCSQALNSYQAEVLGSCRAPSPGRNAYYVHLQHRRELDECMAVLHHPADCGHFCLSVPLTSSVNYGASLDKLEALRQAVWRLIHSHSDLPEDQRDAAKLAHLWMVVDFVNARTRAIHACPMPIHELWCLGLEHLQFAAAKTLAWQKREKGGPPTGSGDGRTTRWGAKDLTLQLNRDALCLLYNGYTSPPTPHKRSAGSSNDQLADARREGEKVRGSSNAEILGSGQQDLPGRCFHLPAQRFGSVGEILERSRTAQRPELEQLLTHCQKHLASLKTLFQALQEVEAEQAVLTEASFAATPSALRHARPLLLNPAAVEIYIELLMVYETAHYLSNLMAQRLSQATYRGLLWFDHSLLPELLFNQRDTSILSLFWEKGSQDPPEPLDSAASTLEQELDLIFEYRQSTNYAYAVQLLSRELGEIVAIKQYMRQHSLAVKTYVHCIPYAASVNYGCTEPYLTHNYRQLVLVLERLVKAPEKDLGKMAHIMEAMKSIMDMRRVAVGNSVAALRLLTHQMRHNSTKRQLLESPEMVPKSSQILDGADSTTDSTAASGRRGAKSPSTRKRRLCDSSSVPNPGQHQADDPPSDKKRMNSSGLGAGSSPPT
uniref:uncharacterized protein isoform X2 n=1 Tax=Pristiophorus japonicus TaxID=55135 RepID=UPI00398F0714